MSPKLWKHLRDRLVDQCALVKNHFALPTKSYGLKCVAPLFGFNWHAPHTSGRIAEIWYRQWLEFGDEAALREVVEYNLDDVRAMEMIHHHIKEML
jgi:predicted RecB family nuclease